MAAKRYTVIFYLALVVAVIATFGVYRVLEATKASSRIATVPVVVAAKDMPEGVKVDRMAVVVAQWPAGTQPAGAYTNVDSVADRVTRVAVYKGEALVPGRLAPEGTGAGLEVKITPGKRAYGIRINDVASLAGMVQPNSRVDIMVVIMATPRTPARPPPSCSCPTCACWPLAPPRERAQDGRPISAAVASIEVTPEESEKLAIAAAQGALQLVLRGYGDPDSISTNGANASDVLTDIKRSRTVQLRERAPEPRRTAQRAPAPAPVSHRSPPVVQAPPPKPARPDSFNVKVFRGTNAQDLKFQKDSAAKRDSSKTP